MSALKVDDRSFQETVLNSTEPVLVDFWAPWCGPCRMMGPVVDELSSEVDGEAKVVKVNVDDASETAARYGIQSIPAFIVFQDGEVKEHVTGVLPKQSLLDLLSTHAV